MWWAVLVTVTHPGVRGLQQPGQQEGSQRIVAEMVDPELHFEPIGSSSWWQCHDSGVVDEDVDGGMPFCDAGCGGSNGLQGGQIQLDHLQGRPGCRPADIGLGRAGLHLIPGGHHHMGAGPGQGAPVSRPRPPLAPVTTTRPARPVAEYQPLSRTLCL